MNGDEHNPLYQAPQQSPADANTLAQNSVPLPTNPSQPRILLPGQEAITPTTYSDQTIPLSIGSLPPNASVGPSATVPSSAPKSEPLGASILYPPIPASYPNSGQVPPIVPIRRNRTRFSKGSWLLVLTIGVAAIIVVLALLVIPVSAFWLPQNAAKTASKGVASQTTAAAPTPIPTAVPTVIPTPTPADANSVSTNGVSVTPGSFDIQNDCQSDNGYRCTVTVALSSDANDSVSWSASLDGVDHSFHPRRGSLDPGQQQQVILYLYDTCPIDAQFDVVVRHQHLTVPLHCD